MCHDVPCSADIALGTTQRSAGSASAFYGVDYEIVLRVCKQAHAAGVKHVSLVSSLGANVHSHNFYLRTKGQVLHHNMCPEGIKE